MKTIAGLLGLTRTGRRMTAAASAVVLAVAIGAAGLAPPASAAAGPLAGTWTTVDYDGSNQTLRITGAGKPVYAMTLRDDYTTGACGGPPAKVVGHGVAHGDVLFMRGTLVCLHGGNPLPTVRITGGFEYDASTDTLLDEAGLVWERAG